MSAPPFELTGGQVTLGGTVVLDDLDFTLRAGEFAALLGANGSGKTTLVRALLRLVPLSAGRLRVFGEPAETGRHRSRIGYVPQRGTPTGGVPATVREVVMSGRTPGTRGWHRWSAADRAAVTAALDVVELADRTGQPVATLSGGQRQRVAIARALAAEPAVLVLDEPTAGVDRESQEALAGTLAGLRRSGTSVLLVAHELGPLAPLLDRVVVLDAGHVVHDGPTLPAGLHDPTYHDSHHDPYGPPYGEVAP